ASDIHLKAGAPPALRISGSLLPVKVPALMPEDTQGIAHFILANARYQGDLTQLRDWDTSYAVEEVGRFRVNIFRQKGNFALVLRAALRQDPDVILVGEMRDVETIDIALKAAETGHLVLSTVHTTDAAKTIGRLCDAFPADAQEPLRHRLAENLKGTISQRLLPKAQGKGRVVAAEIMVSTEAIKEYITDPERTHEITDYLAKNRDVYGTQSF